MIYRARVVIDIEKLATKTWVFKDLEIGFNIELADSDSEDERRDKILRKFYDEVGPQVRRLPKGNRVMDNFTLYVGHVRSLAYGETVH